LPISQRRDLLVSRPTFAWLLAGFLCGNQVAQETHCGRRYVPLARRPPSRCARIHAKQTGRRDLRQPKPIDGLPIFVGGHWQIASLWRRFPPPWVIEEHDKACFIVRDANGQALAYVYFGGS
jgi:hypothetical protein